MKRPRVTPRPSPAGRMLLIATLCLVAARGLSAESKGSVSFSRDILPILSDNCFSCHGPDEKGRKAKLRLDLRDDAIRARDGRTPIAPGKSSRSEIIARILSKDAEEVMPPPSTHKTLTPRQVELLKQWIDAGAPWGKHWAFERPTPPPAPQPSTPRWPRNPIDQFVLARLDQEKLKPAPEADKTTLARRATLDLTGLPPTLEEVDAFLADKSKDAYDKLVDRLLDSERYGEHMARYWMDAVRYADTHGYHIDSQRDIWKYRDWVIRAFNHNQPFDRFTIEQLAGDLLPNPTADQKIATGFVRANMSTGEGGVIEEEYRAKYTFDRVETMGTMYLGMTLVCARCHTHKYDPIQHSEYYGLYAIFNQLDEPVMDGNKPNPDPFMKVPTPHQAERLQTLKRLIDDSQARVDAPAPALDEAQKAWTAQWQERLLPAWSTLAPASARSDRTNGPTLKPLDDRSILVEGPSPATDVHELTFKLDQPLQIGALRLEALPHPSLPKGGSGRADDGSFSLSEIEVHHVPPPADGKPAEPRKLSLARQTADAWKPDRDPAKATDGNTDTAWQPADPAQPHAAVFVTADPVQIEAGSELRVRLKYETGTNSAALGHFRLGVADGTLAALLHPPKFSPWKQLGPLKTGEGPVKAGDARAALERKLDPEEKLDFAKRYPGVREEVGWGNADLADGRSSLLVQDLHGIHGVRYLYRTLTVTEARRLNFSVRADGIFKVWVNGQLVGSRDHEEAVGEGPLALSAQLKPGENQFLLKVVTTQGASYFTFSPDLGSPDSLTGELATILATAPTIATDYQSRVRNYYRRQHSDDFRKLIDSLASYRQEQETLDRAIPTTLVAKESDKMIDTFLLQRGEYDKKGSKILPGVPAIFPPLPAGAPTNRLGLARWLVDPTHPLTARVTVNRIWQQHFGVGLVKTTEDFGVQGERPSHPDLLDWLATEFIRSGWDLKALHKLILTSATYRQSSRATPELVAHDPENRLLARGPRFRLDAEVIRDTALFTSGLLIEQIGGPSVKPYEPPGLWEAVSFNGSQKYVQDLGAGNYRRSLYTFWKRQSPPPNMLLFDAPTREFCTVRRSRANTPLQALALLNDPQFVEASRALAERILSHQESSLDRRLAYGFELATARKPQRSELRVLTETYRRQLDEYRAKPDAAQALLAVGSRPVKPGLNPAELAACTTLASMLLNLDETLTKN